MMQNKEQQFQQEQEFRYYTGYRPTSENEDGSFSGQVPPTFESQMPGEPFMSRPDQEDQFSSGRRSQHGTVMAVLCYIGLWLTGFLFLLFGTKDRFVRFHAMQSLLFFGGLNVLYIALLYIITNEIPFIFGFAIFAFVLINIVSLVAWFVGIIGALQGRYVKLPFVGNFAERYINTVSPK